eukprot:g26709.t1
MNRKSLEGYGPNAGKWDKMNLGYLVSMDELDRRVCFCADIEIIAKGSIGPILKVCKRTDEQIYALKVLLKAEIFRQGMLQQCKEGATLQ